MPASHINSTTRRIFLATMVLLALCGVVRTQAATPLRLPAHLPQMDAAVADAGREYHTLFMHGDRPGSVAFSTRLLRDHADKDWAAELAANSLCVGLGTVEAQRVFDERDAAAIGVDTLSGATWDLMSAVALTRRGREASAAEIFARVAEAQPDWAMPHAYLFLNKYTLMRPVPELQPHLDACVEDASAFEEVLRKIVGALEDSPEHPNYDQMWALLEAGPRSPQQDALLASRDMAAELKSAFGDAGRMADIWLKFAAEHGAFAPSFSGNAAYFMATRLPAGAAIESFKRLGQEPGGRRFTTRAAETMNLMERSKDALDVMADLEQDDVSANIMRIDAGLALHSGASLMELAEYSFAREIFSNLTTTMQPILLDGGKEDLWREHWQVASRERPISAFTHRLRHATVEQLEQSTALLDSLDTLDLFGAPFFRERRKNDALTGDIPDLAEVMTESDPYERRTKLMLGLNAAEMKANQEAASEFIAALLPHDAGRTYSLVNLLMRALRLGDNELITQIDEAVSADDPDDPLVVRYRVRTASAIEGPGAATEITAGIDLSDPRWHEPLHLCDVMQLAAHTKLPELEEETSLLAMEMFPESSPVRYARASVLRRRGENAQADALFSALAAEYPGSGVLAGELMQTQQSVVSLADTPDDPWDDPAVFDAFGHDLDDLEWVRARKLDAAAVDSLQEDAVALYGSDSLVLVGISSAHRRVREVVQILSEAGAEMHRTHVIGFDPNEGVPRLRVARVLTADGKVFDIDHEDVLIRAAEGGNSDVSDAREMVVAMGNLAPGAIYDIVYDSVGNSHLPGGWSRVKLFAPGRPVREYAYEIFTPEQLKLHVVEYGDKVEEEDTGDPRIRRWRMTEMEPVNEEEWGPDWSNAVPWLGLTTYDSWTQAAREYAESFWQNTVVDNAIRDLARNLTADLSGDDEKAAALYRYVIEDINGLAVELGSGRMIPSTPTEVIERGWGDCKDSSALLIALLEAVDIEARPVLVSTWGSMEPREDFPALLSFNHMIVRITGIGGKPYCDPLNGTSCLEPVPAASIGRLALHIDRGDDHKLSIMPGSEVKENGFELEADLTPTGDRGMRYELAASYYGEPASYMKMMLSYADTNFQKQLLDGSVGFGVPEHVAIRSWSFEQKACGGIQARVSYLDTTWAEEGSNEALLRHVNEAANYWSLPKADEREHDVVYRSPYTAHVVVRLHETDVWSPSEQIAAYETKGVHHEGRIKIDRDKQDGHRVLTVTNDFKLLDRVIPVDDYADFRRDAMGFFMHAAQVYRYRHPLDGKRAEQMMEYAEEFPDDMGFRLRAAMDLLGTNFGGHGEDSKERRELARELLTPLVERDSPGMMPTILAAMLESMEGRYLRANEILDAGRKASPGDLQLLAISTSMKQELDLLDEEIELCKKMANDTGSTDAIQQLIIALAAAGRDDEVERQVHRLDMMGAPLDSLSLNLLHFLAYERVNRTDDMASAFGRIEKLQENETFVEALRAQLLMAQEKFSDAADILEKQLADRPTDPMMCNNLAWCLALAGRDLERARALSEASAIMSDDPTAARNTYAVAIARLGDWSEARRIFRELYEGNDQPSNRVVNGYFLGLAERKLGNEDDAEKVWSDIEGASDFGESGVWLRRLEESRRLIEAGQDPCDAVFSTE